MRRIIIFLLSVLFLLFFIGNKTQGVGTSCSCQVGTTEEYFPACVDTSPPGCPSGETCRCNPIVEPGSGNVLDCEPGTCALKPTPTPTPTSPPPPPSITCDGGKGIPTAIGCINVESPTEFVKSILGLAIGIGGGIAFLLMLFGTFQIMTSGGDPERLKAGKELIGSALAGLLMIIFSVFLLQLIGVQILQIPGFGE